MEQALTQLLSALAAKADIATLTLVGVICVLSFLLIKALARIDVLSSDLAKNSQTLARLTELLNHLIYGRERK